MPHFLSPSGGEDRGEGGTVTLTPTLSLKGEGVLRQAPRSYSQSFSNAALESATIVRFCSSVNFVITSTS